MNGLMSKYKDSLKNTSDHFPLSQCKPMKMNLSGLLRYAKEKGIQPYDLSEKEKEMFIIK